MSALIRTPARTPAEDRTTDLRLMSVLESGLPARLGTPEEPAAYTVPLVFSRQVSPAERLRIEDPDTARRLTEQTGRTGPDLRLSVSDRRLLVESTTLEELRDGLADALSTMLLDLGTELRRASAEREVAAEARTAHEQQRSAAVHATVATIRFD